MKIEVLITEVRTRVVEVEACSPHDAVETVREEYEKGGYDLSLPEHIYDTVISEMEQR
jgi:hypothetical protein